MRRSLVILFLLPWYCCIAQISFSKQIKPSHEIILRVKQFSQFVSRFNYEEDFLGKPVTDDFKSKITRPQYIRLLFDAMDNRFGDEHHATGYDSVVNEFVQSTDSCKLKINKLDGNIYACTHCEVLFNGKPNNLLLLLRMEKANNGYKWMLWDAYAGFIDRKHEFAGSTEKPSITDPAPFIPPVSNELNFMHLRKIFRDKSVLSLYISQDAEKGIKAFAHLIQNNTFEYKYVERLKYYIFDIPGWVVTVEEFPRETSNSGWLISDITKWYKSPALFIQYLYQKHK